MVAALGALDLAQVCRLDFDALRHLTEAEPRIRFSERFARFADVVTEADHVDCVRIVHTMSTASFP